MGLSVAETAAQCVLAMLLDTRMMVDAQHERLSSYDNVRCASKRILLEHTQTDFSDAFHLQKDIRISQKIYE